ncbi:hypothetical protein DC914_RS25360 [Vibrio parahaemolyticus]|uniref:hypothetical protein n=1 Tax=Vibrio parahaemolyticus TaxID=670 RepID=UPI0006A6246E|nr:hypothetical protein [Vibrio parahaemolyticus]EJG0181353.1 hypothetical protein [Vibrio parahaemolyticus]KOF27964.1 hypothetical protein ACX13_15010 [Vibrio parahaemolyticus]
MDTIEHLSDFKDELALVINTKLSRSSLSLRAVAASIEGVTPALLSKVRNYKLDSITSDRLILLVGQIELLLDGKVSGFEVALNEAKKEVTVSFLGSV